MIGENRIDDTDMYLDPQIPTGENKMDYQQQALDFLQDTMTTIEIAPAGEASCPLWKDNVLRYRYSVLITRGRESMNVDFYGSFKEFERKVRSVNEYDILSSLIKHDPGSLGDFVQEFGYEMKDHESVTRTTKLWMACVDEYRNVMRLFSDVMDELQEIN